MILRDLLDWVSKEKRKKERVKAVQKSAVRIGIAAALGATTGILFAPKSGKETRENLKKKTVNTVESIKDTVQNKAEMVKDSVAHSAQEVVNVLKDIHGKAEESISDELHKSVK